MMGGIAESSPRPGAAQHLVVSQFMPARLRAMFGVVPQLSRYSLVSIAALALDFCLYIALMAEGVSPTLAGAIGYAVGTGLHYILSTRFVFNTATTDKMQARLLGEFALSGIAGIGVTALIIGLATKGVGLPALPAKVLAAGISFLVVFVLRRSVVFATFDFVLPLPPPDLYVKLTVAGAVFLAVIAITYFLFSDLPSFWKPSLDAFGNTAIGRDFLNTWMGGRSALAEGPAAWFDYQVYNKHLLELIGVADMHRYVWSYPPHILLFIWPFGLLPYFPAFVLWTLLGFAAFLFTVRAGGVERPYLMFAAVAPAVAINVFIGQNGFFMAALLIGGLINLDRRPVLSGMLFGVLTVKPQLGLLLPVVLLLTGRWLVIVSAVATSVALVGGTAWLYGPDIWSEFFAKVVPQQRYLQEHGDGLLFLQISSAFYAARLIGLPLGMAWALQAIVSMAAAAAVAWTFWRPRDPVLSTALLVTAVFLFSPYALSYDMVVLGWVAALLCQRQDNEAVDHYLIVAIWTLAASMMLAGLIRVPLAVLVLLAFATRLLWRLSRSEQPAPLAECDRSRAAVAAGQPAT